MGGHPESEPPISLADGTHLDGNPATAENQTGSSTTTSHVGGHPDSEPPISLADGTCLDDNPSTLENQTGAATTTSPFECGSHSLGPPMHLLVRIMNGSSPAVVESGAPKAALPNAGSSLGTWQL